MAKKTTGVPGYYIKYTKLPKTGWFSFSETKKEIVPCTILSHTREQTISPQGRTQSMVVIGLDGETIEVHSELVTTAVN